MSVREHTGTSAPDGHRRPAGRPAWALDVGVVALWFLVAGVLAGLAWWLLTPLPEATRVGDAASLDPEQLTGEVAIDGWFAVIATLVGLVSGVVLLGWRRRDPVLVVVLSVVGAGLASLVMIGLGRLLGPGDVVAALRALPDGGKAPVPLRLHAPGVALLLPAATALGALVQLWVLRRDDRNPEEPHGAQGSGASDGGDGRVEQPHEVAGREPEVETATPPADPHRGPVQG